MTWSVKELVAWLNEVERVADHRSKFDWLEIPPTASATAIQDAYHAIARTRHPDLFRQLDPAVADRLVRMYGRITAAYADLKEPEKCAAYLRELRGPRPHTAPPAAARSEISNPRASSASTPPAMSEPPAPPRPERATGPVARPAPDGSMEPAHQMNARALAFYRRAEGAQRTGDKAAALLQLKMAIAADPKSMFLRAALVELTKR